MQKSIRQPQIDAGYLCHRFDTTQIFNISKTVTVRIIDEALRLTSHFMLLRCLRVCLLDYESRMINRITTAESNEEIIWYCGI